MDKREFIKNAAKQASLDFYKREREDWIRRAQKVARDYALEHGEVTADIIHALCPPPKEVDGRAMAGVFKGLRWLRYQKSERTVNHHRVISVFTVG